MKTNTNQKRAVTLIISLILLVAMAINLTSCYSTSASNLMDDVSANTVSEKSSDGSFIGNTADFSIELFKKSITDKENSLVSPLSVLLALAMTANGADNETLSQMQTVLGQNIPLDDLNNYLNNYVKNLPSDEKSKLSIANSIWFRDSLNVEKDFLQKNADYYNAAAFKSAFDDKTLKDINNWVDENTDGMIDKILDKIDSNAVMYLINAIVFDAQWQEVYTKNDISGGDFTAIDGSKQPADFMHSTESKYLNDGNATGFMKPYANENYSFVALLPNENVSIEDYIATLSGGGFLNTIQSAKNDSVSAFIPKFSYDYSIKMNDALSALGMPDAFSEEKADFSKIDSTANGRLFIEEVLHKTFISVDELGTKAGAATEVTVYQKGCVAFENIVKLDRPFVYAIIDNKTNLPIFIGTVMSVAN